MLNILTQLLLFSLCASLICLGVHNVLGRENMLLSNVGEHLLLHWPLWLCKILFACLPCMASFWGISLWLAYVWNWPPSEVAFATSILLTPAVVLMVSGFNLLWDTILECCMFYSEGDELS